MVVTLTKLSISRSYGVSRFVLIRSESCCFTERAHRTPTNEACAMHQPIRARSTTQWRSVSANHSPTLHQRCVLSANTTWFDQRKSRDHQKRGKKERKEETNHHENRTFNTRTKKNKYICLIFSVFLLSKWWHYFPKLCHLAQNWTQVSQN